MITHYADRSRRAPRLAMPRNMKAVESIRGAALCDPPVNARASLFVSFVGDIPWIDPTIYCDPGVRYDWKAVLQGVAHVAVVSKPGIDLRDAPQAILEAADVIGIGYPVLIDVDLKDCACIVHGLDGRPQLWTMKSSSPIWQQYFDPR